MTIKPQKPEKKPKIETEPDAWNRFKSAVHKIVPPKKGEAKGYEAQK